MIARQTTFLAVCLFLAGCATSEDTVSVAHTPATYQSASENANAAPVNVQVNDARTINRTKVSSKINGYGMEMAAIRSDRDVTAIFQDAIESELKAQGYNIGAQGSTVKVEVHTFYNQFKTGFFAGQAVASVDMDVSALNPKGVQAYQRHIQITGGKASIQLANGSNAKEALEDVLNKAMATLMSDKDFHAALGGTAVAPVPQPRKADEALTN